MVFTHTIHDLALFSIFSFIGWNHYMHGDNLTLYQLSNTKTGPIIGLSLMVKKEYSWIVSHRNEIVSTENCALLQNIPAFINSGKIQIFWVNLLCNLCSG